MREASHAAAGGRRRRGRGQRLASAQSAEDRLRAAASELEALCAEGERWRREAEGLAAALHEAQGLCESRTAELASAIQRIAELDRLLVLAPPPPAKRRRRSGSAGLAAEPAPSSGGEPGPTSGS
jgi:hypothetical protein